MNKQLLAMAVATAMFAPAVSSADVKVFGRVQVEYNIEDSDNADSVQSVDDDAGQSRIGVDFSEKLGGGLTAFGRLAWKVDPADHSGSGGGDGLAARDQYVGIKGSWGSIRAGSIAAPYKSAGGTKWDPFAATHLQARRAGGMTGGSGIGGHNGFVRNAIMYTSPKVNGFKARFLIVPDETRPGVDNGGEDGDNDYSLDVQYKNGPWHAIFAHNRNNTPDATSTSGGTDVYINSAGAIAIGTATPNALTTFGTIGGTTTAVSVDDETLTKVGLRWKSGAHSIAGQYEWVRDAADADSGSTPGIAGNYRPDAGDDANVLFLGYQYKMGNNTFAVNYGNMDVDDGQGGEDYEYDYWAAGIIHKFSKKTRIFGGYSATDGDESTGTGANPNDRDVWTVGIRADF
jgi:predicted porin